MILLNLLLLFGFIYVILIIIALVQQDSTNKVNKYLKEIDYDLRRERYKQSTKQI